MTFFDNHTHTHYSNIRLLDSINRPKNLIDKAIEYGLSGICITDHEALCAHMEVNQYAKELREKHPEFTIALGNEIYLTETRENNQKYYHFILIAKDAIGHKGLRRMSSLAWANSYTDRKMKRVPLLKSELKEIMEEYAGHIIATTACIGGELGQNILHLFDAEIKLKEAEAMEYKQNIVDFIFYCKDIFGDDFYLECAPASSEEQIIVNKRILSISECFDVPVCLGSDSHYLTKDDRFVHKAYLNSKEGDREVDDFYQFTYLMSPDEARKQLRKSFSDDVIDWIFENSNKLKDKIEPYYSLEHTSIIPQITVKDYPKTGWGVNNDYADYMPTTYPTLTYLFKSDEIQERYWVNECWNALNNKIGFWGDHEDYVERLEIEADIIKCIGEKLNTCLFAYFNTFKHYIDLFWECGSIVGPGRGSSTGFLSNYLLGITQLNPIRWDLPYWRFLNKERAELPDIDIDLAPSRRPIIFEEIRKELGPMGLSQVATFGTETTKSAIQTACRGYRSEEYPDGIDNDIALYMSSLVPQHRGFLWPLKDVVNGNEELDRQPVTMFLTEVRKYPGLLDIMMSIEGLINKRSSHASGVILYGDDPYATAAFMQTPNGDLITQYDLHRAEAAGDTKYDFLVTEASDKIISCYELLLKYGEIEDMTLREFYDKYLHPEVIDVSNQELWDHLAAGDILDVFQFSTGVGLAIAKKLKPQNPLEMTAANAIMRLMSEKGKESQQDRYVRIKDNPSLFEREMLNNKLTMEQREAFHKYCDIYYGTVPLQEQMMLILMDDNIGKFTLAEANNARKIVAKKKMKQIPELRAQLYDHVKDDAYADYIWETAVAPQLGYAFSINHSLPYSFVGLQMIYLATHWNPVYWDTACLIVNSGAIDDVEDDEEADDKKDKATDYGKIAKAMGDIINKGIKISLVDINRSSFGFEPDIENNQILFGLKGMLNIGDDLINTIIQKRPYASMWDFIAKVNPSKLAMVSLIKGGAFDQFMDRFSALGQYIWSTCDKKSRITLQNMPTLMKNDMVPTDTEERAYAYKIYEFTRYLKAVCRSSAADKTYSLDTRALEFLVQYDLNGMIIPNGSKLTLDAKQWDKYYQKVMDVFREWIAANKDQILYDLNKKIFTDDCEKYAKKPNLSAWEMESLCFYFHDHELKDINKEKYNLENFFDLPEEPIVSTVYHRKQAIIPIYKLNVICGTVVAKNKNKSTAYLLTTDGVVPVKFRKEYFSMFDRQISEIQEDGTKKRKERSWFNRGNMLLVQGIRRGDDFIAKKYASSSLHQLYKIINITDDGDIIITHERYKGDAEDDPED